MFRVFPVVRIISPCTKKKARDRQGVDLIKAFNKEPGYVGC